MTSKILIVDDEAHIRRLLERTLADFEDQGIELLVADNGEDALQMIQEERPNLVFLDVMMPRMTGIDVLKKMKADDKLKSIPVIILTNLSGMKDAETAIELGAVKFIIKSDNKPTDVVKQVREILKGYTRDEIPDSSRK